MATRPRIIDADGHIMDREVDIRKYLPPPWSQRTAGLLPADQPWDNGMGGTLGADNKEYQPSPGVYYRRGMSPEEQVDAWHRIMDQEGFDYAMCFPTGSGRVVKIQERDFQVALARAINDHLAREYNARSSRLSCVGVLPMAYPEEAAKELHRAVTELGLKGFEVLSAGVSPALGNPVYDPIYSEAERLGAAICIHGTRSFSAEFGAERLANFCEVHTYAFPAGLMLHFTSVVYQGVPSRFPNLKLAFLEIGATWLPYYLDRMDEHWEKRSVETRLNRKPSEVVREANIYFSVEAGESLLPEAVSYLGDQHFLYASDIPHWDNEFPESLEQIWEHPRLSTETKEKILAGNARALFGLGAAAAV